MVYISYIYACHLCKRSNIDRQNLQYNTIAQQIGKAAHYCSANVHQHATENDDCGNAGGRVGGSHYTDGDGQIFSRVL